MKITMANRARGALGIVALPWNAFVAAFLYYTVLTLVAIGGGDMSIATGLVAYSLPPLVYAGIVLSRGVAVLSRLQIDLHRAEHAVIH